MPPNTRSVPASPQARPKRNVPRFNYDERKGTFYNLHFAVNPEKPSPSGRAGKDAGKECLGVEGVREGVFLGGGKKRRTDVELGSILSESPKLSKNLETYVSSDSGSDWEGEILNELEDATNFGKKRRRAKPEGKKGGISLQKCHTPLIMARMPRAAPIGAFKNDAERVTAAIQKLQLTAVPEKLPCREEELEKVYTFLLHSLQTSQQGSVLYISGVPGTGKTATVNSAIQMLLCSSWGEEESQAPFKYIYVNGLEQTSPEACYQCIYRQLFQKKSPSPASAYAAIDAHLCTAAQTRTPILLVVDEIDKLITRKQKVLYTLFDWPHRPKSKFVVVGISNLIDLPNKLLPKIRSRLGFSRVLFLPYKTAQIIAIIKDRLKDIGLRENGKPIFDPVIIQICAQRIAIITGDIRLALRLCSRTLQLSSHSHTSVQKANQAYAEIRDSLVSSVVRYLPMSHRMLLACVIAEKNRCRAEGILWPPFLNILARFTTARLISGAAPAKAAQVLAATHRLSSLNLISTSKYIPKNNNKARNAEAKLGFNACPNFEVKKVISAGGIHPSIDAPHGDIALVLSDEIEEDIRLGLADDEPVAQILSV